jgi:hypothetical protein
VSVQRDDVLVPADVAAVHLASVCQRPLTAVTIRKWASRQMLTSAARAGRARLYLLEVLCELVERLYAGGGDR